MTELSQSPRFTTEHPSGRDATLDTYYTAARAAGLTVQLYVRPADWKEVQPRLELEQGGEQ